MLSKAIVRIPCKNFTNGLTTANLGLPDYDLALIQHKEYVEALRKCGLKVVVLDADEDYPDSTFVEDTALLTKHCAIITNLRASSRKGETIEMKTVLTEYFSNIETINDPGTVEAGDIMMVGDHYYIGLSQRTNINGAEQLIKILKIYGMTGSVVTLDKVLHLKSGVAYLENNNIAAAGEFLLKPEFRKFNIFKIDDDESYAANCIWINDNILLPKGFPKARKTIEKAYYDIIEVNVSEFQKLDGGLSCLSLRF
ncbi:MAG: arginine deiminase family protein [Ignavibacteriaceae bacterium]